MATYTKSKCKVMFAQCSGNSVISRSFTVCIGAYQYHKSWFFLISLLRCSAFFSFFSARVSSNDSPRFHPRFTRFLPLLSHLPRSLSRITQNRDHGIAPMIAESRPRSRPWCGIFSPRVVLNVFFMRVLFVFVLFFLHSLTFR